MTKAQKKLQETSKAMHQFDIALFVGALQDEDGDIEATIECVGIDGLATALTHILTRSGNDVGSMQIKKELFKAVGYLITMSAVDNAFFRAAIDEVTEELTNGQ